MIKNIIFDLGDIFVNLDKEYFYQRMEKLIGDPALMNEILALNKSIEVGEINSDEFVEEIKKINSITSSAEIVDSWNSILLDIPTYRIDFIEKLAAENKYRLFLLSNTNAIHINHIKNKLGTNIFNLFKNCFEQFYLSHEIGLRKPSREIYKFVLSENNLIPAHTLFIDDTIENIEIAEKLGIKCWNLIVGKEDVITLQAQLDKLN